MLEASADPIPAPLRAERAPDSIARSRGLAQLLRAGMQLAERTNSEDDRETSSSAGRVPQKHRALGAICDRERPSTEHPLSMDGPACATDADCVPAEGSGYCMYSPELAHWTCGYGQCVG